MAEIAGIVLGAGSSRRLGRPKQTLALGDTTLLGWVLRDVEASSLPRVLLVLGGAAGAARWGLAPGRAEVVHNDRYGEGCASSLLAGLDAAGPVDAVMLILGDMPGVDARVIDAVRAGWEAERPWAAVTDYAQPVPTSPHSSLREARGRGGSSGHPFVFSAAAFPALRALHGDKAVWRLLDAHPERIHRVPVDRPLPRDVDTWDDYEAVRAALTQCGCE